MEASEVAMATARKPPSYREWTEDAGTHESLAFFSYMKYSMDFLNFFPCEGAKSIEVFEHRHAFRCTIPRSSQDAL